MGIRRTRVGTIAGSWSRDWFLYTEWISGWGLEAGPAVRVAGGVTRLTRPLPQPRAVAQAPCVLVHLQQRSTIYCCSWRRYPGHLPTLPHPLPWAAWRCRLLAYRYGTRVLVPYIDNISEISCAKNLDLLRVGAFDCLSFLPIHGPAYQHKSLERDNEQ
jgi:hypothetical protein